ncbi:MAG: hypothetical protein RI973_684 [Bacteroidota bacterium]|jgi:uncharacterized protein YbbC (DUF1343 family)
MVVNLKIFVAIAAFFFLFFTQCSLKKAESGIDRESSEGGAGNRVEGGTLIAPGAERLSEYLPLLKGKKVGAVVNHTSMVGAKHLVDTLLGLGIEIDRIFAPEHGFRGTADAGEIIKDGKDAKTGIPVVSLYGSRKKPSSEDLAALDLVLFDIQDVGVRFYTYISTLTYVMEACAENNRPLFLLDRPNPNGFYVDGPVLDTSLRSFVGMHQVPVVYGMTIGEYAWMVNGEKWLPRDLQCQLSIVPCSGYDHSKFYELPVKPSPNLPNMRAIYLYPSLCFFEGTDISVGRGTDKQFQIYGAPGMTNGDFTFTPQSREGAKSPPHLGLPCRGHDLSTIPIEDLRARRTINLQYLTNAWSGFDDKERFFLKTNFFEKLAGRRELRTQIQSQIPEKAIRDTWEPALSSFKVIRKKYLLYPD